jgi:hypothetical protein
MLVKGRPGRGGTVLAFILVITSCATTPSQRVYWLNPSIEDHLQQPRFTLDSTECTALARQLIPEPSPDPAPNAFEAGRQRAQRERARSEYGVACMINRGWEQRTQTDVR